jgi:hypothetical protein
MYQYLNTGVSPVSFGIFCVDNKGFLQLDKSLCGARASPSKSPAALPLRLSVLWKINEVRFELRGNGRTHIGPTCLVQSLGSPNTELNPNSFRNFVNRLRDIRSRGSCQYSV